MNPSKSTPRSSRPAVAIGLVLALLPFATVLWVQRAAAAPQPGDLDAAIATQLERVAQLPATPEVHNDLGNLLALAQDREAAEAAYREALQLDPDYFPALFNLAVLLRTGHRPQETIEVLNRAIEVEPDSAWSYYQRGAARQELGHRKQAIQDYARAFALDPRLALPDVNPLVIGNPLVTAAMLTPQDVPVSDVTPRSYAEPARISQLLLPPPPPPAEEGATTEATPSSPATAVQQPTAPAVGEVRPPSSGEETTPSVSAQPTAPPPPEGDDEQPRRITVDDVRSLRILNQASPEGEAVPAPEGGSRRGVDLQAPQRFRPGRRSSAQLDLRMLPDAAGSGDRSAAITLGRR